MASRSLTQELKDAVLIDWRLGQLSQRDIADKHKVSKGTVGNICKGAERDAASIVGDGVQYKQGLAKFDGQMVGAIDATVNDLVAFERQSNDRMEQVARKSMAMLETAERPSDAKAVMETLKIHREARLGKPPDVAVQINNSAQPAQLHTDQFEAIARKLIAET